MFFAPTVVGSVSNCICTCKYLVIFRASAFLFLAPTSLFSRFFVKDTQEARRYMNARVQSSAGIRGAWVDGQSREKWLKTQGTRSATTKPAEPILEPIKNDSLKKYIC
ncbi:unnamed protein product, partial [Ectocarpus sp. 12 AP-2014]